MKKFGKIILPTEQSARNGPRGCKKLTLGICDITKVKA